MNLIYFLIKNTKYRKRRILKFLKAGEIKVNDILVTEKDYVLKYNDVISLEDYSLVYKSFKYYMLNKPKGFICSHKETEGYKSALSLINDDNQDLFMVGRLDVLTEGLLLITNDGKYAYDLVKNNNDIKKTYLIELIRPITNEAIIKLERGVKIANDYLTKPATVKKIDEYNIKLTICEGKFHQVKQMIHAVDNHLLTLVRVQFGNFKLLSNLKCGRYIEIEKKDIN